MANARTLQRTALWVVALALAACDVSTGPVMEVAADPGEDGRTYPEADVKVSSGVDFDTINARDRGKVRTWVPDPTAPAAAVAIDCDGAAAKPGGGCCDPGQAWSAASQSCAPALGGTCKSATDCALPWCFDRLDGSGLPCSSDTPDCRVVPRDCKATDIGPDHRCLVGQAPQGNGCAAVASGIQQPFGGSVAATDPLPSKPPELGEYLQPLMAPPPDLPTVSLPTWCANAVGDAVPCPEGAVGCSVGQVKGAGGSCVPLASVLPAWCPPGFVGSGEPALCTADLADCGSGTWGNSGASNAIYVDGSAAAGGNGSSTAPLNDLAKALAAAATDTTVVVAAGSYTLPPQGLTVPATVTLRGRCPQLVKLQADNNGNTALKVSGKAERLAVAGGNTPLLVNPGGAAERLLVSGGKVAAVNLNGALRDSLILPGGKGIEIASENVVIERVRIDHAVGRAFAAYSAAKVQVTDLAITSTQPSNGNQGRAVVVAEAAQVTIDGLRTQDNSDVAVVSTDAGSLVALQRFAIVATKSQPVDGTGGQCVAVTGGAQAMLRHGRILQSTSSGVLVSGAQSAATMANVTVEQTQAGKDGYGGEGLRAQSGGTLTAQAVVVTSAHAHGVLGTGALSKVSLANVLVSGTEVRVADGKAGHGAWFEAGSSAELQQLRLSGNHAAGLGFAGSKTTANGDNLTIDATQAQNSDGKQGFGLMVVEGASVKLGTLRAHKNRAVGVLVADPGSYLQVVKLTVDETLPRQNDGSGGIGVSVEGGASLLATTLRVHKNRTFGVQVDGDGSSADLGMSGAVRVDGTQPGSASQKGGWGIAVAGGGQLKLSFALIDDAREVALAASGTGTQLEAYVLHLQNTMAGPKGEMGRALVVEADAVAKVKALTAFNNRQAGVSVHSAKLDLEDGWISGTAPDESTASPAGKGQYGRGITVAGNAKVNLLRVRLSDNREAALSAYNQSTVRADHLSIDATLPQPQGSEGGRAIDVAHQAVVDVQHGILRGHVEVAAAVSGQGAILRLADVAVQKVVAAADGQAGMALAAQSGGLLQAAGVATSDSQNAGVAVRAAKANLYGVSVANVQSNAAGQKGFGVQGYLDATGVLRAVRVTGAHGSGLLWREGALNVDNLGVFATATADFAWGKYTVSAGDGATLIDSQVTLKHAYLSGNARAGAVFSGGSVSLSDVLSSGNGIGWCLQGAGALLGDLFAAVGNTVQVWLGSSLPVPTPLQPVAPRWALYPLTI
ncbi:MAG: hypothetical protein HY902_08205 [Deltaproteobacteria bacterium]|nr:hypothetical protein [Deltaproteobacteria bacterium]